MQLQVFFTFPVIIWDLWLFNSCVKRVIAVIKMPLGISLGTSQYFHSQGARIALSTWERRRIIYSVGICHMHYLSQEALQQTSITKMWEWEEEEQGMYRRTDYSLCNHTMSVITLPGGCVWNLKKYSGFRALEAGEKCSFPVLVSCGEQKHWHGRYIRMYI